MQDHDHGMEKAVEATVQEKAVQEASPESMQRRTQLKNTGSIQPKYNILKNELTISSSL